MGHVLHARSHDARRDSTRDQNEGFELHAANHTGSRRKSNNMTTTFRVATFNCENLFSRPKMLNYVGNEKAARPLAHLATLDKLLAKAKYKPDDKRRILELLEELSPYVRINALRGRLMAGSRVKAAGRSDWVGGIELKRVNLPLVAQENTARVIKAVGAEIQCVVEVDDRLTLESFNRQFLAGPSSYPYNMLIDGNDHRGIDVGLLSKYPIGEVRTHVFDTAAGSRSRIFSRDCLEVSVMLPDGRTLHVLINHFKSKLGQVSYCNAKRKAQANRVVEILRAYDLRKDLVVIAGDLNDCPTSEPLHRLLDVPDLVDVLTQRFVDPKDRWTCATKEQIDYLLVSRPLARAMIDAGVERRGLLDAGKLTGGAVASFETVTSDTTDASDHCAVWGEFRTIGQGCGANAIT